MQAGRRMAVLFITHDFGVVAEIADRVAVMQQGRLVELGDRATVLHPAAHSLYPRADRRRAALSFPAAPRADPGGAHRIAVTRAGQDLSRRRDRVAAGTAAPRSRTSLSTSAAARRWASSASRARASRRWRVASRDWCEPDAGESARRARLRPARAGALRPHAQAHPDGLPGSLRLARPAAAPSAA